MGARSLLRRSVRIRESRGFTAEGAKPMSDEFHFYGVGTELKV